MQTGITGIMEQTDKNGQLKLLKEDEL